MVAEPIKPPISKMPPKKGHVGRKYKGKSGNAVQRAANAASDAAVANGDPNPTPVGRPAGGQAAGGQRRRAWALRN